MGRLGFSAKVARIYFLAGECKMNVKLFSLLLLSLMTIRCSPKIQPVENASEAPITLRGLIFVDMYGDTVNQYPLLCKGFGYHPDGAEFVFKHPSHGNRQEYHAVFPKGITPPKKKALESQRFTLHGDFVIIQEPPVGQRKEEPHRVRKGNVIGYKYFLVSSWSSEKAKDT